MDTGYWIVLSYVSLLGILLYGWWRIRERAKRARGEEKLRELCKKRKGMKRELKELDGWCADLESHLAEMKSQLAEKESN